jgi:NTE family protein
VTRRAPRIGIALGSGSFRGWAHLGVLRALGELGVRPEVVCGCSVGALVGAAWLEGRLDALEDWALNLGTLEFARLFDVDLGGGAFVDRERLARVLGDRVCPAERRIEEFEARFAAVATDLTSGKEVWFTEGSVHEAVRASMSLPGIFPAVPHDGGWLVDGGLVNPVPVSLCRALGADRVIAVNLNGGIAGRYWNGGGRGGNGGGLVDAVRSRLKSVTARLGGDEGETVEGEPEATPRAPVAASRRAPGVFDSVFGSVHIVQDRITRSRMAGDPPDVLITPRLSQVGLLDYARARDCIDEGRASVRRMEQELHFALGLDPPAGDEDGADP